VHKHRERTNVRVEGSLPLSRRLQLHSGVIGAGKFCVRITLMNQSAVRIQQLELKKGKDKQHKDSHLKILITQTTKKPMPWKSLTSFHKDWLETVLPFSVTSGDRCSRKLRLQHIDVLILSSGEGKSDEDNSNTSRCHACNFHHFRLPKIMSASSLNIFEASEKRSGLVN
jgi:hypothetical protein